MTSLTSLDEKVAITPPTSPVCVACGNRNMFLLNTPHEIMKLASNQVSALSGLQNVICGRCGSHHSTILEYDAF